jgi:hypothetical protein
VQVQLVGHVTPAACDDWSVYGQVSESPLHDPPGVMAVAAGQSPTSLQAPRATATAARHAAQRLDLLMLAAPGHCVTVSTPFIIM